MSDDMIALSRRAVACRGWRWLPGMSYWWVGSQDRVADEERGTLRTDGSLLPDLADFATLGCVLALVREAWGDHIVAKFGNGWWELETDGARWDDATTQSFVEALVAALESAP